jgi:hypothetical protein
VRRLGFWRWAAVLCGPVLWMIHLSGVSAFASGACGHHAYEWLAHGLTAVTGLPVLVSVLACASLARRQSPGGSGTVQFIGWFGVGTGALSLLLILLEEAYIWAVRVC